MVLVYGDIGERISGPAIRGWEIAKGLATRHRVTAAVHGAAESTLDGIRIVPLTRFRVAREAPRHDAAVASSVPPYVLALKAFRRLLVISDQYDPVDLELGTLDEDSKAAADARAAREVRLLQLAGSDVLVCAAAAQRRVLEAELRVIGRRPPIMAVVPFGLPEPPPPTVHRPLRERFPQIRDGDKVVLWWGSIWRWLDAATALRAFEPLARTRPDLKLVLTAGRPPRAEHGRLSATEEARGLALSMGLLGRTVLFLDDWVPYRERHRYLIEADLGLTLHRDTPEAPLAARARYMDYLWTGLPCLLTEGDETAESLREAGFARLVPALDSNAVREELLRWIDDPRALERAAAAGQTLADAVRWPTALAPLIEAIEAAPSPRVLPPRSGARAVAGAAAYYARRTGEMLAPGRGPARRRSARVGSFIDRWRIDATARGEAGAPWSPEEPVSSEPIWRGRSSRRGTT